MKQRLHKILAAAGIASRRACETYILSGRIQIDGEVVTTLGTKVDPESSEIRCDGQVVNIEPMLTFLINKPKGYVCTNAQEEKRPRVIDLFGKVRQRLYTAGRLDVDSTGLLIVTNDGSLTHRLTHPSFHVPKTYQVKCRGRIDKDILQKIRKGIWLAEGKTSPARIRLLSWNQKISRLEVTLFEGRNRQIRRMFASQGHPVLELRRTRVGHLSTRGLPQGHYRRLSALDIEKLFQKAKPKRPPRKS
ncbi:MAG: pseudouridine synthase [Planctomycetota bacterium]|jgi:23S rRNA pseudouridine2605 synthase|nr:pseudouridine synthase [Planctomycetota bacterium]